MDEDHERRVRKCAFGLVQAVGVPVRLDDGSGDGASFLVIEQRHSIREAQQISGLVGRELELLRGIRAARAVLCMRPRSSRSRCVPAARP